MPVKMIFKRNRSFLKLGLAAITLFLIPVCGFADMIHYVNGKIVKGKLDRVTGDIIEFRETNRFGSAIQVHRIELTNRHDVVMTKKCNYFGEIVYLDRFKLDLRTATGLVNLNRLKIKNVVLGSPNDQPVSNTQVMQLAPESAVSNAPSKARVEFPSGSEPLPKNQAEMDTDREDYDTIPAVNR